ncbi:MAG: hypothetical protein RR387_00780 [Clostridiales bacterium]
MRDWLSRFMAGRNGADHFCRFLTVAAVVFIVLSMLFSGNWKSVFTLLAYALLLYSIFRMLSRNVFKRQTENRAYLQRKAQLQGKVKTQKVQHSQRKNYVFLTCPSCKAQLRLPKGKGKVTVTCPRCQTKFEGKS